MDFAFDSTHGLIFGIPQWSDECFVPPGSYNVARVGFRGPANQNEYDFRTFSVTWMPYPTPVNPVTLEPVHRPLFVLKSYTPPLPPNPMQTVIAVTPTIDQPLACPPCWGAIAYGPAVLSDSDLCLVVDNIGPEGNAGVSMLLPQYRVEYGVTFVSQRLSESGSEMNIQVQGTLLGSLSASTSATLPVSFCHWTFTNTGGKLNHKADFSPLGAPNVAYFIYHGDSLVYADSVPSGASLGSVVTMATGAPNFWLVQLNDFDARLTIVLDGLCLITPEGGPTYTGNVLKVVGVGRTKSIWSYNNWLFTGKATRFVIKSDGTEHQTIPYVCCLGRAGDVDGSGNIDISDLSWLIDFLYISFPVLYCPQRADCDGVPGVDIADLSALIDYLYISFTPTASCQ